MIPALLKHGAEVTLKLSRDGETSPFLNEEPRELVLQAAWDKKTAMLRRLKEPGGLRVENPSPADVRRSRRAMH